MPILDQATIGFLYAAITVLTAVFVHIASKQAGGERGFHEWSKASLCMAFGVVINTLQETLPLGLAIGISNFLLALGCGYFYQAFEAFFDRPSSNKLFITIALIHALVMSYLAVVVHSVPLRLFWFNTAGMLAFIAIAYRLWKSLKTSSANSLYTALLTSFTVFVLLALQHLMRLVWFIVHGTPPSPLSADPVVTISGVLMCVLNVGVTFSFLIMQSFRLADELREEAEIDGLTGLLNRRGISKLAQRLNERSNASQSHLAVLMLDIDHFKKINDQYGHQIGDKVLRAVAVQLSKTLRPNDLIGRYGGEEFIALLAETDSADAIQIAERIRKAISEQNFDLPQIGEIKITLSIGIASSAETGYNLNKAIGQADISLYQAKANGRNQVVKYNEPDDVFS